MTHAESTLFAAPVLLGLVAVYALLPRPRGLPWFWGALAGGFALLLGGWWIIRVEVFSTETLLFYAFSAVAIIAGVLLITQRNPARAALSFALVVLSTCGLFLLQAAPFLMAATAIVYAGAIVVTFLFVLMLAQQQGPSDADNRSREPLLSAIAGFVLLGALLYVLHLTYDFPPELERVLRRTDATVAQLDALQQRLATRKLSQEEVKAVHKEAVESLEQVHQLFNGFNDASKGLSAGLRKSAPQFKRLYDAILDATTPLREEQEVLKGNGAELTKLKEMLAAARATLAAIADLEMEERNTIGSLRPPGGEALRMSNFSGPPANVPYSQFRRDEQGRPQMPAENVAYVGRSLFTDYLLAVELGGTLLLVAAIGAIAIANRRSESVS